MVDPFDTERVEGTDHILRRTFLSGVGECITAICHSNLEFYKLA